MPNTPTHDRITLISAAALLPIGVLGFRQAGLAPRDIAIQTALLIGGHLLSGLIFSPDLDLQTDINRRWGPLYWIWRPYMWAVPHRNFWSHGLILPPILRLLYVYVIILGFLTGGAWLLGLVGVIVPSYASQINRAIVGLVWNNQRPAIAFTVGFILGGAAHSIADWLVTGGKYILLGLGIRLKHNYDQHDRWVPREPRRRRSWEL